MSMTAQELIKAAMRLINATADGETPTASEMADGLEALKIMLRSWSSDNLMIYFIEQETLTLTGASSYTIGSGGDCPACREQCGQVDLETGFSRKRCDGASGIRYRQQDR